ADQLLAKAREVSRTVRPERLGNLGPNIEGWPSGYAKTVGTNSRRAVRGRHHAEIPFVLEAYAEIADRASFQVSVNRTPVTADIQAIHSKETLYVTGCGLDHDFTVGRRPVRVCLNIETPHMPITSDGKTPDLRPFLHETCSVLEKAVRRAKRGIAG